MLKQARYAAASALQAVSFPPDALVRISEGRSLDLSTTLTLLDGDTDTSSGTLARGRTSPTN